MALDARNEQQLDALQQALEAEEAKLVVALANVRNTLDHLKACRHEHRTGKPLQPWRAQVRMEDAQ